MVCSAEAYRCVSADTLTVQVPGRWFTALGSDLVTSWEVEAIPIPGKGSAKAAKAKEMLKKFLCMGSMGSMGLPF